MYARTVEDRTLTLAVSGMLWKRSLVMIDSQTKSLWSHLLGQAMRGPLKGANLKIVPSSMTDWGTWRKQHPDTTVLMMSRTARTFLRNFYTEPAQFVVAIASAGEARAWPFDQLLIQPVVNDLFRDTPLLVLFDAASVTASVFQRRIGNEVLEFTMVENQLIDRQTRSIWQPLTGVAVDGPRKGQRLAPTVAIVSFRRAWMNFHPDSTYWHAGR